jgi:hypothetical protein
LDRINIKFIPEFGVGKWSLGRPRTEWDDVIKINLMETGLEVESG